MENHRTYDKAETEYFIKHPEEIDDFLRIAFDEFANDGDSAALLSSLRVIARVRGISNLAAGTYDSSRAAKGALCEGQPAP